MNTKQLRQKILDLAMRGKLVAQDPNDEPAAAIIVKGLYELPKGWVWTSLGKLFNLQAGKFIQASDISADNSINRYPCYGGNGLRGYVKNYNREGDYPIIGRQGALCGNLNFATGQFYATEHAVSVECPANANPKWAFYFLDKMNLNQYATAQPGLSVKTISEIPIPLPPLAEQRRIVAAVDSALAVINELERNKADLLSAVIAAKRKILSLAIRGKLVPQDPNDEPAEVLLGSEKVYGGYEPFEIPSGWVWTKLGYIGSTNIGLTYKPMDICNNGIPVLRSNNIKEGRLDFSELVRVKTPLTESLELNNGDIVICTRNGSKHLVGKCALIQDKTQRLTFGAFMAVYRSIFNPYVYYFLHTDTFRSIFQSEGISTQINQLTQAMIKQTLIPIPPLAEQRRIVAAIEAAFRALDRIVENLK